MYRVVPSGGVAAPCGFDSFTACSSINAALSNVAVAAGSVVELAAGAYSCAGQQQVKVSGVTVRAATPGSAVFDCGWLVLALCSLLIGPVC